MRIVKILAFVSAILLLLIGVLLPTMVSYASHAYADRIAYLGYSILFVLFIALPALRSLDKTFKDYNRYN